MLFLSLLWKFCTVISNAVAVRFLNECLVQADFSSRFLRNFMLLIHLQVLPHLGCGLPPRAVSVSAWRCDWTWEQCLLSHGAENPILTVRLLWPFNSTGWSCWLSAVLSACNCCSRQELNGGSLGRQQAAGVGRRSPWHHHSQVPAGDGWWGLSGELLPSSSSCFVQKQPWLLLSQAISSNSVGNPEAKEILLALRLTDPPVLGKES